MIELIIQEDAVAEGPREIAEIMAAAPDEAWRRVPDEQLLLIDTPEGRIAVELSSVLGQDHVEQIKLLSRAGYYEGLSFYRVIEGFVAQGGDHTDDHPKGKARTSLEAEFEEKLPEGTVFTTLGVRDGYAAEVGFVGGMPAGRDASTGTSWLAHCTGAFAFGRNNGPDTASTEFYITLQPQRYLDRNLTVFGRVLSGMDVVQAAPRGVIDQDPETDDFSERLMIDSFRLAADLPEEERPAYEVMNTESDTFAELIEARKARPSAFFIYRPGHVDLCQMTIPTRTVEAEDN
ncbi:peptidylprolyl isomerase [Parvularcula maris]|uniref:peptidylprolyl isomerase n=1 Tax=Parvularcula maris TaxID=2965077 RepID=A0A9X2L9G9_9PROT|nr:peptidylprolyl isomerase [Parvularcula maris]MCQ8185539.1 peptidylprolyl isomerase [Parvularcula maris]